MNKLIPLLAFSILLLVPVGAQNAFAGGFTDCAQCESFRTQCLAGVNPDIVECNSIADQCLEDLMCSPVVGGESLSVDSTALMLAGLQSSAIWMLPILAGAAGAGAFYIKSRMNKD